MSKTLTARAVEAAKGENNRREVPDGALPGLYLVIQPTGAKSWCVRYRAAGRPRKLTLGKHPALNLADAREKAREALRAASEGSDPAADKRAWKADERRDAVSALVGEFLHRHSARNRTATETARIFDREVLPKWGDRDIAEITRRDVIELIDGIVDRGSPIMANRTLATIRTFFNWSVSRDIIASAPTTGVQPPARERSRNRVLSDAELRWFWAATERMGWPFGPLYQLLVLTCARRAEVGEMTWREISGDRWTIPSSRAKNGRELTLSLTGPARAIIAELPEIRSARRYLFTRTGERPISGYSRACERLYRLMLEEARKENPDTEIPHFTIHDLRRTAASGMARLGVQLPVIEKVLNHVSGTFGGIVAVYQKHTYADEMADALGLWAGFVVRLTESGDAVPMRA